MKKKIIYAVCLILIVLAAPSCEKNCKFCKNVTYENGNIINEGTETEYCGAALATHENLPDIVVGDLTTKVECR
jgi:hypothetical protein